MDRGRRPGQLTGGVGVFGDGAVLFTEQGCHRIRQVQSDGILATFAGTGQSGPAGDHDQAINATFNSTNGIPTFPAFGMAFSPEDPPDELYVADTENHVIREINLENGHIETFAGSGIAGFENGSPAQAMFNRPTHVFASHDHAVWVVDSGNHAIRRIDPLGTAVETIVGTGTAGFNGDDIPSNDAQLNNPSAVFVTDDGDVLITDTGNHRIRFLSRIGN